MSRNVVIRILPFLILMISVVVASCVKVIAGEENRINDLQWHSQRFGMSAKDLLSDQRFTSLRIEIQYAAGLKPDSLALNNLQVFLEKYLNKPEGIFIQTKEIQPLQDTVMERTELIEYERANRTLYNQKKQLGVYLLYANGSYINPKILGLAYQNTSAVIFGDLIKEHSGRIGQPSRTKLETTVLLHEMGHLLGLINKGSAMVNHHQDADHESHCDNPDCLMYYKIGTQDRFGYLIKGNIPVLDHQCEADLKENGGK